MSMAFFPGHTVMPTLASRCGLPPAVVDENERKQSADLV